MITMIQIPVSLPEWAEYVAVDADGAVFAYRHPPVINEQAQLWDCDRATLIPGVKPMVFLGQYKTDAMISNEDDDSLSVDGWRASLMAVRK